MQEPKSVAEVKQMLKTVTKGDEIKQCIENCVIIFENDPLLSGSIKKNDLTGRTDIVRELPWKRRGVMLTDLDFNQICLYLEVHYNQMRDKVIRKALDIVSGDHRYHPIQDELNFLEWDGVERMKELLPRYLGAESSEYVVEATRLLLLGAISRVFHPGCKFESMVCIVGEQGAGKSTFFRFLAIKDEWFTDDLRRIDDDNVYRKMQGHWFIEMAEMLATSNARSIEEIKSFISRQKETYKIPYETHPEDRPRQCVFVGTSNSMSFLPLDRTGNRRFIPIRINQHEAVRHPLEDEAECRAYIRNCWAEAMCIYRTGEFRLALPRQLDEKVKELQQEFTPEDTRVGLIQAWLDSTGEEYVCSRMIFEQALGRANIEPNVKEIKDINCIMNNAIINWEPVSSHRFGYYGTQRAWRRRNKKNTTIWSNPPVDENGFVVITEEMKAEMPFA